MKVGVLTYHHPENRNYGAMLQLYATYTTLNKLGYEPIVINYKFTKEKSRTIKSKIKNLILYYLGTFPFADFSRKYMPNKTEEVSSDTLKQLNASIDVFLVGSDQVWRYSYVPDIEDFFFSFVDNNHKKISYAASFGLDYFNEAPSKILDNIKKLIHRFDAISVREVSGVKICQDMGALAQLVADPVFLLNENDYLKLINEDDIPNNGNYIAQMLLDTKEEDLNFINSIAADLNVQVFNLKGIKYPILSKISNKLYSVPQWLGLIKNSKLVVTDSFHCVAFCIIFKKPFICIANHQRGMARLESLLGMLDLKYLIHQDVVEMGTLFQIPDIDYDKVYNKLDNFKNESLEFLKKNLPSQ